MGWFDRKKRESAGLAVQLRGTERQPFGMLERYVPLRGERRRCIAASERPCQWWMRQSGS